MENTENKITVDKFIEEYNKRDNEKLKEAFIKSCITRNYITYAEKLAMADAIINNSCVTNNGVKIDSCKKYYLYVYFMIRNYTNIEIDPDNAMFAYDDLDKNELIEQILNKIPQHEVVEGKAILDMKYDDFIQNNCDLYGILNNEKQDLLSLIDLVSKSIEKLDPNQVQNIVNKILGE